MYDIIIWALRCSRDILTTHVLPICRDLSIFPLVQHQHITIFSSSCYLQLSCHMLHSHCYRDIISFHPNPDVNSILDLTVVPIILSSLCLYLQSDTFNDLGYTRLFTAVFRNFPDTTLVNRLLRCHSLLCLFVLLTLLHARVLNGLGTTGCETLVFQNRPCDRAWARGTLWL